VDMLLEKNLGQHEAIEKPLLIKARLENEAKYTEKEPLVSINIPTYSRGKLLVEKTLPSIFAQTYERYEVVIVGDHCADNTEELIRKLNHPKVRFYDLPDRPVYPKDQRKRWMVAGVPAINKSIELSNGLWLAHLDDDDVYTPDHIEALLKLALEGKYEFVIGLSRVEIEPGKWEIAGPGLPTGRYPFRKFRLLFIPHSATFERSYLKLFKYSIDAHKLGRGADNHRWWRMGRCGVRNGFLPKIVVELPLRPGEIVRGINQPE